jgi:TPR repeat protein
LGPTDAVKWVRKAADQGNANAQNSLGVMYANGHGVPQIEAAARRAEARGATLRPLQLPAGFERLVEAHSGYSAYRTKPAVAAAAHARVDHSDVTASLNAQGFARSAFIEE